MSKKKLKITNYNLISSLATLLVKLFYELAKGEVLHVHRAVFSTHMFFDKMLRISLTTFMDIKMFYYGLYIGGRSKEFVRIMKAPSDPNRLKIIKILEHLVMSFSEIK